MDLVSEYITTQEIVSSIRVEILHFKINLYVSKCRRYTELSMQT